MSRRIGKFLWGPADICLSVDHETDERHLMDVGHASQEVRQASLNAQYWRIELLWVLIVTLATTWAAVGLSVWGVYVQENWMWDVLFVIFQVLYTFSIALMLITVWWRASVRLLHLYTLCVAALALFQWVWFILFLALPTMNQIRASTPNLYWPMFTMMLMLGLEWSGTAIAMASYANARNYCDGHANLLEQQVQAGEVVHQEVEEHFEQIKRQIASNIVSGGGQSEQQQAYQYQQIRPKRELGSGMRELLQYY